MGKEAEDGGVTADGEKVFENSLVFDGDLFESCGQAGGAAGVPTKRPPGGAFCWKQQLQSK